MFEAETISDEQLWQAYLRVKADPELSNTPSSSAPEINVAGNIDSQLPDESSAVQVLTNPQLTWSETTRGNELLILNGYEFYRGWRTTIKHNNESLNVTAYRCPQHRRNGGCSVRVWIDAQKRYVQHSGEHTHPPVLPYETEKRLLTAKAKEEIRKNPSIKNSVRNTIDMVLEGKDEATIATLDMQNLARQLQRARRKLKAPSAISASPLKTIRGKEMVILNGYTLRVRRSNANGNEDVLGCCKVNNCPADIRRDNTTGEYKEMRAHNHEPDQQTDDNPIVPEKKPRVEIFANESMAAPSHVQSSSVQLKAPSNPIAVELDMLLNRMSQQGMATHVAKLKRDINQLMVNAEEAVAQREELFPLNFDFQ